MITTGASVKPSGGPVWGSTQVANDGSFAGASLGERAAKKVLVLLERVYRPAVRTLMGTDHDGRD